MMGPRLGLLGLLVVVITVVSQSFTQEDFEGNLPEIGTSPVDLVFVIDTSAATNDSAGLEDELQIKSFFASFLESADTDSGAVRVGMVTYSTHPEVVFKLDSFRNKVEIQAAVLEAEFRGGERNTADALSRVRSQMLVPSAGDRRDVPNVILLFTSGKSDRNSDRTLQEADALKYAKTNIFVLGYGLSGAGVNEAQDMASKPVTENSFEVTSIDELDLIREIVFAQIFTRAEMAYKSPAAGSEQLDMGFLIHFSSKMKRKDFKNMLTFMRRILDFASLDDDSVRVGAAVYRKRGTLLFDFKQYQTRDDITKAIESIPYSYRAKATGTASGLDVIRTELFNAQAGDRDNVPNLLVVITDSNADVNVGQTIKASEQLKATGTAIFTVGLNVTYKEELTSISTSPEYSVFVNDTQYLSDQEFMLQDLFVALRAEEEVEYVIPEKQTTLAPTVASTETTTTIVYTTTPVQRLFPPLSESENADIVFALHLSPTATPFDFGSVQNFLQQVVSGVDIESGNVKIGVMFYAADPEVIFHINQYDNVEDMIRSIQGLDNMKRDFKTDASGALDLGRQMLSSYFGRRGDVPAALIFITDSASTTNVDLIEPKQETAVESGIDIYAIGINLPDKSELETLATSPNNVMTVLRYGELYSNIDYLQRNIRALRSSSAEAFGGTVTSTAKVTKPSKPAGPSMTLPPFTETPPIRVTLPGSSTLGPVARRPGTTCRLGRLDLVIILDASTSVTEPNFKKMLDFTKRLLSGADIDSGAVKVGVVVYSTDVTVEFQMNRYSTKRDVLNAIDNIKYIYGSTNTADAIKTMADEMFTSRNGDRPDVEDACIVITDGVSNINSRYTVEVAQDAHKKNIHIYAIGIGLTDREELDKIATPPAAENSFLVKSFEDLDGLEDKLFKSLCPADAVEVTVPPIVLKPMRGMNFIEPTPVVDVAPSCGLTKVDVVLILDASTSVRRDNFKKMLEFCKDIVDKADIDSGSVRIGALIYSTKVEIQFHLDEYTSSEKVKEAIGAIKYIYGSTNSASALETMHEQMFVPEKGDRPDADNIAFMITDGVSNINSRRTIPEAREARAKGIKIYAIGIGLKDTRELEGMASEPSEENTFNVQDFDELSGLVETIFGDSEACEPDLPPTADAGRDVVIQLPEDFVTLSGAGSTDDKEVVIYFWELSSGIRNFKMEGENQRDLQLRDLKPGLYTFTLTVFDALGQSDVDTVQVLVEEPDLPPIADAGQDIYVQLPVDIVVLNGDGSSDDKRVVAYEWVQTSGSDQIGIFPAGPRLEVVGLIEGEFEFTLTVFDELGQRDEDTVRVFVEAADEPPIADAGENIEIQLPRDSVTLSGVRSRDDVAVVSYSWTLLSGDSSGLRLQALQNDEEVLVTGLREGAYVFRLEVADEKGQTDTDTVEVNVRAADIPPKANAGKDIVIQLPENSVTLDGSLSTDDIGIVTYEWNYESPDPATFQMDGSGSPRLELSGLDAGVYKFSLTVTDEAGLIDIDGVTVTVKAADKPPNADAGRDIIEKEPVDRIVLDGSQSSDDVGIVRYRWRQREGDRSVVTKGDRSEFLTLSNLKPGQYRFTLTVVDGAGQRDTDNVLVTIIEDEPPQANAGPDYSLPSTSKGVVLLGNKSTDDVGIVTYQWRQIAGDPSALTLTGVNRPNLGVNGLVPGGFYSFELTVTDGIGQTSADTVTVVVDEAVVEETCGLEKVDLVFVVDASTSVTEINFKKQLNFMKSIVQAADIDSGSVRVGALTYSTGTDIQFYLNTHNTKADVLAAIDKIKYTYGSTNTADGLRIMRDELFSFRNGDREDVPNTCIIITDGVSNINARDTIPQAELSRDIGIHIYAVGIGLTDTRELDEIASEPASENSFAVTGFEELKGLESKIFSAICEETTPTTTTTTTTTTTPTPTTTPPACRLSKTDVVIILDASTSVTEPNFQKMRDFVKQFISNTDVDSGSVRFGLNIYSSNVDVRWHLNSYSTIAEIEDAVDKIPYVYGSTNTADALKVMHKEMFTIANGDRPDAPDICIILTDGVSNINARRTIPDAEAARQDGIHIYAIGIGLKDTTELDAIASVPASENSFNVQSFDELRGLEQKIFSAVCPGTVPPPDYPPVANAGEDQYIQLPESRITLSGLRSTDDKEIVSYTWSLLDGPAVDIRDTNSPELQLYNMQEGTYFIELEVMDELGQKDTDEVTLYVLPEPDLPPTADAGSDIEIQIPTSTVTLNGRASFDDKRITSYAWSKVSGPGSPSISGRGSATPTVSNLAPGEYVFRVVVSDAKGQSDEDTVRVVVKPPIDRPPKADAGRNFTIQLPDDSVTLNGCSSTDDIRIQRYEWQLIFGNGSSVRARGNGTCSLSLSGLAEGPYGYRLTVYDDKGQSSSDMTYITVKRAPRTTGYDVVFVLDSSVSPDKFRWMNDYARMIIREMDIDNEEFRVGYLIYSNGAYRQFDLNAYDTKAGVFTGVDRVGYRPGSKNTAAALNYVRNRMFTSRAGDRDFAKNYVILLTGDGASRDPYEAALEACLLQEEGVGMFSVGLGEISDRSELNAYSSLPTEDYELVIEDENKMGELPGLMLYNLKRGTPRKTPCPAPPVTTTREPGVCGSTGDIVFILDSSGSVGQENFYRVLNFTYSTIEGLNVDDGSFRVAIITFSDTSRLEFNLNDYTTKKDLKEGIRQVRYTYGNTHTAHALRRARTEVFTVPGGDRPDVPNVVVIITDGQSNVDHELTIPEARALKSDGVTILTVAVGFTSETSELSGLTSPPVPDNLIYVADYAGLAKLKDKLIEPLCTKSNMCRSRPCQNGGVCVDGIRSFVCICPDDFFGDTCNKECGDPSDVVIVLDSSSTVGPYNFARLKEYAQHLVQEMNKDACDINIGFMKYSSAPMVQVYLGMHTDTETNIRALESISYSRGRANMAAAFRALRTQMFNGRGGDRPNAKNIAYFLTDGTNDINADMAEPEADLTISSGTRIIPIGINMRNRFELDNIAALQGINVIEIDDEPGLIENTDKILRPMYTGNEFCAESPCRNGATCKNEPFGYRCECPIGFTGDTCSRRCTAKGNVVFAVDTSRYVTRTEMKRVRKFLRSVVKRMRFKRKAFSVGMVQFSDWAKVTLQFGRGTSKKAVRAAISGLRVHGGEPEPAMALAKANYRIFTNNKNGRDKPEYLIMVTKSMRKELDILHEANKLKVQGTKILGVGLGLTAKEQDYMESTVSLPASESTWFANDVTDLDEVADKIVSYMCDDEDMCAANPCRNNGTCHRRGGDFYCTCAVGYAGRYCQNRCNARADVVFLLDSSGSIGLDDFRNVKQFVHNMVSDLVIGKDNTRVGLATYSSTSRLGFYLNKYFNLYDLQNAIAGIQYEYGNTNTADGLRLVREYYFNGQNGDRREIQNFLLIITDGESNVLPDQTIIEADRLKKNGVHIYAVGIGKFDPFEINSVASTPASENAYMLSDYKSLSNISSSIVKRTCRDPSVCDENPCRNGGICVPGINGAFCECRAGYRGPYCNTSCVTTKDIFFVLDSSDSVGPENFKKALQFVSKITEEFSSKYSYNRFSLLTYSTEVQIVFSLGRYSTLPIMLNAIRYTRYRPGNTNTAGALRTVQEISISALGDRRDAENIVFMIADGTGNVDEGDTIPAAEALKNSGARIMAIGVNMENFDELEDIASKPSDLFKVNSYSDLEGILEDVIKATCVNGNVIEAEDVA